MIVYEPGNWGIAFACSLYGSVVPKALMWSVPCSLFSVAMHIAVRYDEDFGYAVGGIPKEDSGSGNVARAGTVDLTLLGGFTFILGFLVVFRSQQAYSRWWEGGTLLQQLRGEWFNAYSSLLAFCNATPENLNDVAAFQHQLVRLVSLLYGQALSQVSTMDTNEFEFIDLSGIDIDSLDFMQESHDRCEVVLQWIQRLIVEAHSKAIIKVAPPILSRVYNQLGNGIVNLNNARKITEFPIPFPLAQLITILLLAHWLSTALFCALVMEHAHWAAFLSFIVIFSFWSINYISMELEQPFGDDLNDLPLRDMQKDLNASLVRLLAKGALDNPRFIYDPEQHNMLYIQAINLDEYSRTLHSMRKRGSIVQPTTTEGGRKVCLSMRELRRQSADPASPPPVPPPRPKHSPSNLAKAMASLELEPDAALEPLRAWAMVSNDEVDSIASSEHQAARPDLPGQVASAGPVKRIPRVQCAFSQERDEVRSSTSLSSRSRLNTPPTHQHAVRDAVVVQASEKLDTETFRLNECTITTMEDDGSGVDPCDNITV